VPDRLRQLIEPQGAQLPPIEQRLLEAASVVGVEFTTVGVAAGLGGEGDEVEEGCARLAREQFLRAAGTEVWPDGTVTARYGFRHALYEEVFYARIPAGRRARWQGNLGRGSRWTMAERLGLWRQPWQNILSGRGPCAGRAVSAAGRADRPASLGPPRGRAVLRPRAADARTPPAAYRQAITLARDLGMRPLLAHAAPGLGTLYQHTGQRAEAHGLLSTALALFAAMGMTSWETHARTI
jgi:hypothetical protein